MVQYAAPIPLELFNDAQASAKDTCLTTVYFPWGNHRKTDLSFTTSSRGKRYRESRQTQ